MFGQIPKRKSLRDLIVAMEVHTGKLMNKIIPQDEMFWRISGNAVHTKKIIV